MIGQHTLPAGFRFDAEVLTGADVLADGDVLVNDGPADPAAGRFGSAAGALSAAALWSRQVLTDGRLRAVAVVPPATGPEPFQAVHATAELVAARLGIGAVEVAVCWADGPPHLTARATRTARTSAGWRVAGLARPNLLVLLTDAALDAAALARALAALAPGRDTVLLLASGAAGQTPPAAEFAAELAALLAGGAR